MCCWYRWRRSQSSLAQRVYVYVFSLCLVYVYHVYVRDEVHKQDPSSGSREVNIPEDGFWFLWELG